MPRYTYHCEKCEVTYQVVHSIKEKLTDCEECGSKDTLNRIPSIPLVLKNKQENGKEPAGSFVKEYIENAKDDLKQEKEVLRNQEYKDG